MFQIHGLISQYPIFAVKNISHYSIMIFIQHNDEQNFLLSLFFLVMKINNKIILRFVCYTGNRSILKANCRGMHYAANIMH